MNIIEKNNIIEDFSLLNNVLITFVEILINPHTFTRLNCMGITFNQNGLRIHISILIQAKSTPKRIHILL